LYSIRQSRVRQQVYSTEEEEEEEEEEGGGGGGGGGLNVVTQTRRH
jgi:hypothetical protein